MGSNVLDVTPQPGHFQSGAGPPQVLQRVLDIWSMTPGITRTDYGLMIDRIIAALHTHASTNMCTVFETEYSLLYKKRKAPDACAPGHHTKLLPLAA